MGNYIEIKGKIKVVSICEKKNCAAKRGKVIFQGSYGYCPYCGTKLTNKILEDLI